MCLVKDENEEECYSPEFDVGSFKGTMETITDFNKTMSTRKIHESPVIKASSKKKVPIFGTSATNSPYPLFKSESKTTSPYLGSESINLTDEN